MDDKTLEVMKQIIENPALESLFFTLWSQKYGNLGNDSDIAQNLGPHAMQDQGRKGL